MPKNPKQLTEKEYENLGRVLEQIVQKDYIDVVLNKRKLMWVSFLKGLASGFGAFLGATIVVGALLWFLSLFDSVPFINTVKDSLDKANTLR